MGAVAILAHDGGAAPAHEAVGRFGVAGAVAGAAVGEIGAGVVIGEAGWEKRTDGVEGVSGTGGG